jgi:uncharacterized protein with PIN domain
MSQKYKNSTFSSLSEDFKFITDASLGRLAKWLRLWGYDTIAFSRQAGREMLRLAAAENRIVLTRRQDMTQRQFPGRLLLIKDIDIGHQLHAVICEYSLAIDKQKMFGICLECNEKLSPVEREAVRDLVPPFVFENCPQYNQCPRCQKIYWMGTHQRNSFEFMKKHIPDLVSRFP